MNNLPPLPPEVWICIFHHATYVPGALIPDIYAHASLIGQRVCNSDLRVALITKRAIVRVCKQWWHLAIPFLYQSVYIGRARCLSSLSSAMAHSTESKGIMVSARPMGEYTQRLDIAIRDHAINDSDSALLAAVITRMPCLAIVSFVAPTHTLSTDLPDNVLDALHHSATSLRVLDWTSTRHEPSLSLIADLLAKCTQLHILNLPRLAWCREFRHNHSGFSALPPTLSTLRLHAIIDFFVVFEVWKDISMDYNIVHPPGPTSLQELILDLYRDPYYWQDCLHVYSSQLVSVQFYIPTFFPPLNVEDHMKLLAQVCPDLHRLTITSERFSSFVCPNPIFPCITHLALRVTRTQSTKKDFGALFTLLEKLSSNLPSLKVVQLLNDPNLRCLLNTHTKFAVRTLLPFTEASPFRVEDQQGILLTGLRCPCCHVIVGLIDFGTIRPAKSAWTFMTVIVGGRNTCDLHQALWWKCGRFCQHVICIPRGCYIM